MVPQIHQLLLNIVETLTHVHEALAHVVYESVELVGERSNRLRKRRVLLARCGRRGPGVMIVTRFLDGETPLVAELDLADGLGSPRAVNLARRRCSLLRRAVVFDAATITYEVVPSRLAVPVVGGAKFHDAIAMVLGPALDRAQQVLERSEDALGWGQKGGCGGWCLRHARDVARAR